MLNKNTKYIDLAQLPFISLNIEKPVPVNPETDSKIELINVTW